MLLLHINTQGLGRFSIGLVTQYSYQETIVPYQTLLSWPFCLHYCVKVASRLLGLQAYVPILVKKKKKQRHKFLFLHQKSKSLIETFTAHLYLIDQKKKKKCVLSALLMKLRQSKLKLVFLYSVVDKGRTKSFTHHCYLSHHTVTWLPVPMYLRLCLSVSVSFSYTY